MKKSIVNTNASARSSFTANAPDQAARLGPLRRACSKRAVRIVSSPMITATAATVTTVTIIVTSVAADTITFTTTNLARCKSVYYCGEECQRKHVRHTPSPHFWGTRR
mmetsp:Transcript_76793/g.220566  ORF Transcript_76793/g.220566 Transcript_76793/m.220566 type:complete len:108 (-) Transcript_76793:131-454(-)